LETRIDQCGKLKKEIETTTVHYENLKKEIECIMSQIGKLDRESS
jgi:hypothetical protein